MGGLISGKQQEAIQKAENEREAEILPEMKLISDKSKDLLLLCMLKREVLINK